MFNYIQRLTGEKGDDVRQLELKKVTLPTADPAPTTNHYFTIPATTQVDSIDHIPTEQSTYYWFEEYAATGLGEIDENDRLP